MRAMSFGNSPNNQGVKTWRRHISIYMAAEDSALLSMIMGKQSARRRRSLASATFLAGAVREIVACQCLPKAYASIFTALSSTSALNTTCPLSPCNSLPLRTVPIAQYSS